MTIQKNVPPAYDSISLQCLPQLLSDRFENLIHNILRNESSTLEINVSLFGVLHWQQWQAPTSTPGLLVFKNLVARTPAPVSIKKGMVYSRKKQTGGWGLFWKPFWNFSLFYFTPVNSRKNKALTLEIPKNFVIVTLEIPGPKNKMQNNLLPPLPPSTILLGFPLEWPRTHEQVLAC